MPRSSEDLIPTDLGNDPLLAQAAEVLGFKILPPCVLYERIGAGGMGAVYRGRHLNLDIDVAVKCLMPTLIAQDETFVARFEREGQSAAQITHHNVIRVFDVAEHAGLHYLVMEYVPGENARQLVRRTGALPVGAALQLVHDACLGLGEAHRTGLVHRDIKPDNLMVSSQGQVKVADLGLAKPTVNDRGPALSAGGQVLGTPQYMPPEQWESGKVTSATDVWAMGAVLYFLLTGRDAIAGDSVATIMNRIVLQEFPDVRTVRPDVPAAVAELLLRATDKAPGKRYNDARALAAAIDATDVPRGGLLGDAVGAAEARTMPTPPPRRELDQIKQVLRQQGLANPAAPASAATASAKGRRIWPWVALVAALVGVGWALRFRLFDRPAPQIARTAAERIDEIEQLQAAGQPFAALRKEYELWRAFPAQANSDREAELVDAVWSEFDLRLAFDPIAPVPAGGKVHVTGRVHPALPLDELVIAGTAAPVIDGRFEAYVEPDPSGSMDVTVHADPEGTRGTFEVTFLEFFEQGAANGGWSTSFEQDVTTVPAVAPGEAIDRDRITITGTTNAPELIVLVNNRWFSSATWRGNTFFVEVPLLEIGDNVIEVMVRKRDERRGPLQRLRIRRRR